MSRFADSEAIALFFCSIVDLFLAVPTVTGHIIATDPRAPVVSAGSITTGSSAPDATFLAQCGSVYRHTRATIKIILATPESRRIYFFLCLNLAFMFVQMAYGVWTNSLGLISDCQCSFLRFRYCL